MSHTSFPGSFGKSVTATAIRHGHTGHNKPLSARKKVERLEKTEKDRDWGGTCTEVKSKETLQTQTPEMANVVCVRGQHIHTWRELTGYRAVARFCYSWIEIGHSTKQRVHFRQLPVLRWSTYDEVTPELKSRIPLCFPWQSRIPTL